MVEKDKFKSESEFKLRMGIGSSSLCFFLALPNLIRT